MSTELQRLKESHAKLSEQVKEARRVIALYHRWEQAIEIEGENPDSDVDSDSMFVEASFAAADFRERWESVITT